MRNMLPSFGSGYRLLVALLLLLPLASRAQTTPPSWSAAFAPTQTGSNTSQVQATALNAAGDVFVTGYFTGQATFGTTTLTSTGDKDVFVAKWNTAAGTWAWATAAGGTNTDSGSGIAVSGTGVYVTGSFQNNAANSNGVQFGSAALAGASPISSPDAFVAKYTDAGSSATFNWAVAGGGTGSDVGAGIAVSGTGVFVTGSFANNTANASGVQFGGIALAGASAGASSPDVFVAKYTDAGSSATFSWARGGGGTGSDAGTGITVSGTGVYLTGYFTNTLANASSVLFGSQPLAGVSTANTPDVLIAKYTDGGSSATLAWVTAGGGFGDDYGQGIAVSGTGIFLTGSFVNNTTNANGAQFGSVTLAGASATTSPDVFVAKYTDYGTIALPAWAGAGGGTGSDAGTGIAVSGTGVYLTGSFQNNATNANAVQFGSVALAGAGSDDAFVAKYTDAGSSATYNWATTGGGGGADGGTGIAVRGGQVAVGGYATPPASFGSQLLAGSARVGFGGLLYDTPPTLTGISPASGLPGTSITLTGSNLTGATAVTFSGISNNAVTAGLTVSGTGSNQIITVTVPGGAATGAVTVTTPNGTSNGLTFAVLTTAPAWAAAFAPTQALGNNINSQVLATALNATGDVFMTGYFSGQVTFGTIILTSAGDKDVFVAKWNTAAGTWAWVTTAGGTSEDRGQGIAVNGTSVYVTGGFANSAQFGSTTLFTPYVAGSSNSDAFVAKYTDGGSSATLNWVTAGGGTGNDYGQGIAVSGTGVFVTGRFFNNAGNTFGVQFGGTPLAGVGTGTNYSQDAFVAKYTDAGNTTTLAWAVAGGGTGSDVGNGIAVSGTGVFITGNFLNDLANTNGVHFGSVTLAGVSNFFADDVFTAKYTDNGSSATANWATAGGGDSFDASYGIAVSGTAVFITGYFTNDAANFHAAQFGGVALAGASSVVNGSQDVFVVKYNDAGSSATLGWARAGGGSNTDAGYGIAVSGANVFVTGYFASYATFGGVALSGPGTTAVFVAKYTDVGNSAAYNWATAGGGYGTNAGCGIAVRGSQVAVGGYVGLPATFGSQSLPGSGGNTNLTAGFGALLYDQIPSPTLTSISPASGPVGTSVTLTGSNLSGATAVTFGGTTGNTVTTGLTVSGTGSNQTLTITVPAGAATGAVTVTTPSGTGGGVSFTVAPNLVISTPSQNVAAGTYTTITVQSGGSGSLQGSVSVLAAVTVQAGGTLNTNCQPLTGSGSFTLAAGGTLVVCDAAGISASGATGAVQTTGTRSFSTDATYSYSGTASQSTGPGLPAQVRELVVNNPAGLSLSQPLTVAQRLRLTATTGNFSTAGQALTLLSTAAGTALVVNEGAGTVSGTLAVQRYIDGSLNAGPGFRYFSFPVVGAPFSQLATATGGFTPVLNTSYNSSPMPRTVTPFPNVFAYEQSRLGAVGSNLSLFDQGFFVPTTASSQPGQGYAVYLAGNQTVTITGQPYTGNLALTLHRNSGATAPDAGWALVGNPYPAPLDLSLITAADRPNLNAAVYVLQSTGPSAGGYPTYVNGLSTGLSSNALLASSQGFFIRVSAGQTQGTLTFRNAQRATDYASQATFQRQTADPRPAVRLTLAGTGLTDAWIAYAETGATSAFNSEYDAAKLLNTHGLNLSSTVGSEQLAIDGQTAFTAATVLPLAVGVPAAGSYTFTAEALRNLPAGLTAYLLDAQAGTSTALSVGTSYSFSVSAAQASTPIQGRFGLAFSPNATLAVQSAPALAAQISLFPNPTGGATTLTVPGVRGASAVQVAVLNALGQLVARQAAPLPAAGTSLVLPTGGLPTGVYTVRVAAGEWSVARRLTVN